jgi:cleavage and polyadenylation specificity factor subunit 1
VVVITTTGIIHIDQGGKVVGAGVNAWWEYTTNLKGDTSSEERRISLEGSRSVFVSERDMLLILANGDVHQVRFEMEGRSVGNIKVDEKSTTVPPPSSVISAGDNSVFIGSAEGDSLLAKIEMVRELANVAEAASESGANGDMEVDYDEDLYGDAGGEKDGTGKEVYTGPSRASVTQFDVLAGIGKIMDMEFGIAATDQGVSVSGFVFNETHEIRSGQIRSWSPSMAEAGPLPSMCSGYVRSGCPPNQPDSVARGSYHETTPFQRTVKQRSSVVPPHPAVHRSATP